MLSDGANMPNDGLAASLSDARVDNRLDNFLITMEDESMNKLYRGALVWGLMLLAGAACASPQFGLTAPSQQAWKPGPQVEPIMPKGYSLTKGHVFGFVAPNVPLSAQNSPMNDPYAPLQIGYEKIWGCGSTLGQYCFTNGSYYVPPQLQPYVMTGMRRIYIIWYGNWSGDTATTIIPQFINALNYSPYESMLTTYTFNGMPVSPGIFVAGQYTAPMTYGTNISDADIQLIVQNAISAGAFPVDPNGIYLVLTAANVAESATGNPANGGMCTAYCGWHSDGLYFGSADIKYAFIGNGESCGQGTVAGQSAPGSWPGACIALKSNYNGPFSPSDWNSPNRNPGADGMVSVIAHETEEAATDPGVSGAIPSGYIGYDFFAGNGYENGDQCAWRFGANSGNMFMSNGSYANMVLDGRTYLIQKNVVLASATGYSNYGTMSNVNGQILPINWANWWNNHATAVGGSADYCGLGLNSWL